MNTHEAAALISAHVQKYPLMTPQDAIKLLYQSEFGPAHAVPSPEAALRRLVDEYRSVEQREGPLAEMIGGGYARLDLHTLDHNGVSPGTAAEWFVESAAPAGDKSGFAELILALCREPLPLDMAEFARFAEEYVLLGCPAVHHSEAYNRAYSPAYRVVKAELLADFK